MLIRPAYTSLRLARSVFAPRSSPLAAAFAFPACPRPTPPSRLLLRQLHAALPAMADIQTPEVPPAAQQDAPNLQKDPETGEMVSKRCAPISALSSPRCAQQMP